MAETVRLDSAAIRRFVQSPTGPVALDLLRRGRNVETMAKRLCPVRKQSGGGQLRASITHFLVTDALGLACMIGSSLAYAIYVVKGSDAVQGKLMRWIGDDGQPVFATSRRGIPGRDFLTPALEAART